MKIELGGMIVEVDETKAVAIGDDWIEVPIKDGTYGEGNVLKGNTVKMPRSLLKPAVIQ